MGSGLWSFKYKIIGIKKHIAEFIVPPIIDAASPIVSMGIAKPKQIKRSIKVHIKFYLLVNFVFSGKISY